MNDLLPFIVVGVAAGSLYGLAGLGLTLSYKTSGVFNFAHGSIAATAAFAFFSLHRQWGVPWPVALVAAVGVVGVVAGLVVERVSRSVGTGEPALAIVATVGPLLAIQGLIQWRYGIATRQFDPFLRGTAGYAGSVAITWQQVAAIAVAGAAAVALFAFFRFSRLGAQMRAVVDDSDLLDLTGTSPVRVRTVAWVISATFAALSGVLIAPFLGLDAGLLTLLVVQAFGAVAIGRFTSLGGTYLGGIGLGVGASLLTKWVASTPSLGGLPSSLPFLVLFLTLLIWPPPRTVLRQAFRPASALDRGGRPAPLPVKMAAGVGVVTVLLALPLVVDARLPTFINGVIFVMVFASLSLLVRTSGQISLCHATFAALGATSFAHFTSGLGLPWFVALVLAGLAVIPLGVLVAVPAIRLSGLHLALATFGLAILMERVVYPSALMFGAVGSRRAPRPWFAQTDTGFYYVAVALAAAACVIVVLITRTRLGHLLRGLGESPTALLTNGLAVSVTRLVVFAVSAFLAGTAGALFAAASGNVSGRGFGSFDSLLYLVVLTVAGRSLLASSVLAALALAVAPAYLPDGFLQHQALIFGLATVAVVTATGVRIGHGRAAGRRETSPVRARGMELAGSAPLASAPGPVA